MLECKYKDFRRYNLRVISGSARGHRLKAPKGDRVRPTEDRIKESLFNILGHIRSHTRVLDIFGGSGSIGIEFLSRGAKEAYIVDIDRDSIKAIRDNLEHTKLEDRAQVLNLDAFIALDRFESDDISFHYIYIDPPFNVDGIVDRVMESIDGKHILEDGGLIMIEHEKELLLEEKIYGFERVDSRKYGNKFIDFYKKKV